jgi:hypothetical protein
MSSRHFIYFTVNESLWQQQILNTALTAVNRIVTYTAFDMHVVSYLKMLSLNVSNPYNTILTNITKLNTEMRKKTCTVFP